MPSLYVQTPLFGLLVTEQNGAIVSAEFASDREGCASHTDATPLLCRAQEELVRYANGERTQFDLPVAPEGTPFMCRVWQALVRIPYGQTATYGQIAAVAGSERAARAVGQACNRNPIAILIPCHRVVGAGGALTGFAGGLETKERLLAMEHRVSSALRTKGEPL
ncbi:MAG: methylated-DNA--[protein]-cysteine S-methyltransferase [Acetanaerobacterium sp.]